METGKEAPTIQLSNGLAMPALGLGTSPLNDEQIEGVVKIAIKAGYRMIDTAENYRNEAGVGLGLRASGIDRAEVFVTTKFNRKWHGFDEVQEGFEERLVLLGLDYVDLLLIHWPNPAHGRFIDAWRGMIKLYEAGKVKAIGLSNFKPAHIDQVIDATGFKPMVNQVQFNPHANRQAALDYHAKHGIVTQGWNPLAKGLLDEPVITATAARHGKTAGQVALRWQVQRGVVPIPRSSNAERLAQNLDVFDFTLSAEEMAAISALDRGGEGVWDSDKSGH